MSALDSRLAYAQLEVYMARVRDADKNSDNAAALRTVHTFLKTLRERWRLRADTEVLKVDPVTQGPRTFAGWLSARPDLDRRRSIKRCNRILGGLKEWYPRWLRQPGVVCYERAAARISSERVKKGRAYGPYFLSRIVKTISLPTLTASRGNHYVVVEVGKEPRFMTVQEVARSFMVPEGGPLWAMLARPTMAPIEAVSALGRGVHVGVARAIVSMLMKEGALKRGLSYGSAYSGVDTFAAAVDAETGGDFSYAFASEIEKEARRGLIDAWGCRGLAETSCHHDAEKAPATTEGYVDFWVATPECNEHSAANRGKTEAKQASSIDSVSSSLEYVRLRRPRVVVVENVVKASIVPAVTGMLSRLAGYRLRTAPLGPSEAADAPTARQRQFWVLVAIDIEVD